MRNIPLITTAIRILIFFSKAPLHLPGQQCSNYMTITETFWTITEHLESEHFECSQTLKSLLTKPFKKAQLVLHSFTFPSSDLFYFLHFGRGFTTVYICRRTAPRYPIRPTCSFYTFRSEAKLHLSSAPSKRRRDLLSPPYLPNKIS